MQADRLPSSLWSTLPHSHVKHFTLLLGLALGATVALAAPAPFALGANFNENLHAARLPALDATGVTWIRGFLPATEFLDGRRRLADDPALATFRAAAASGRRLVLSLKWDFVRSRTRVPAPGSARERACFAWALDVVRVGRPDLLLLINEVFIDTPEEDMRPAADGAIPMVRFLQRLAAHVAAAGRKTPAGAPLPVGCGGFTRINTPAMQNHPATRALLPWLASSPHLTHVNFHLHQNSLAEFAAALAFMRQEVPARPFVVTEFSLVWALGQGLDESLGVHDAGRAFAARFHHDPAMTVRAYLSAAAKKPVPEAELHALLASRTWFDPQFLATACRLLQQAGVTLATYAYLQESSGLERAGSPIRPGAPPWRLNAVFQERHAYVPGSDRLAVNHGLHETFLRYQHPPTSP